MKIPEISAIKIHEVLAPMPHSLRDDWVCFSKVPINGIHVLCHFTGAAKMDVQELEAAKVYDIPDAVVIINCPTFEVGQQMSVTLHLDKDHAVHSVYGAIPDDFLESITTRINRLIYEAFNQAGIS